MPHRPTLDRSLEEVRDNLLRLASMVDSAIARDIRALVERDCDLAQQVSNDDGLLNDVRYKVEAQAYALIATQQPTGTDLRAAVAAVSVATNLERMGDHAAGIARLVLRLCDQPLLKPLVDLPQMAEIARQMMRGSLDAYLKRDCELARQVVAQDAHINRLHEQIYRELLGYMMRDASAIERATFLLWISHGLERIGDRSKNICERAIYLATGELVEFGGHPS
ncbi:MAG: phosphate signaling complex protein PhoU [Aggregatilineales bacterium]